MTWVLRSERHYTNGTSAVIYHKGVELGMFHICVGTPEEAEHFRTKKDAMATCKLFCGKGWEAVKI